MYTSEIIHNFLLWVYIKYLQLTTELDFSILPDFFQSFSQAIAFKELHYISAIKQKMKTQSGMILSKDAKQCVVYRIYLRRTALQVSWLPNLPKADFLTNGRYIVENAPKRKHTENSCTHTQMMRF